MEELEIIGEKLKEVDPDLATHLYSLDIPPQLYGVSVYRSQIVILAFSPLARPFNLGGSIGR